MISRLGPGMMMAATAVGVSHLVHSTRAGAGYGLTMALVVIIIVFLKYPAFRFAVEYASVTGKSLVHGYFRQGRIATAWLLVAMLVELLLGTSVLSLVTAGVLISVFELSVESSTGAIIVAVATAAILVNGRYTKAEGVVKVLVIAFSLMTLLATIVALPRLGSDARDIFSPLSFDLPTISFVIAMTGYMPLPLAIAIFQSVWVREKKKVSDYTVSQAVFDLNVGWWLTAVLALCFMIMGTAVLFQTETTLPASAPGFATMLFGVFTDLSGDWLYPVLAAGGLAVIWSTLIAVMDAVPRICDRMWHELSGQPESGRSTFRLFLVLQVVAAGLVLTFFLGDFATFIDIAAGLTFLVAPAIAWFNYRAMLLPEVAAHHKPARKLVVWNGLAIGAFIIFALVFLMLRLN